MLCAQGGGVQQPAATSKKMPRAHTARRRSLSSLSVLIRRAVSETSCSDSLKRFLATSVVLRHKSHQRLGRRGAAGCTGGMGLRLEPGRQLHVLLREVNEFFLQLDQLVLEILVLADGTAGRLLSKGSKVGTETCKDGQADLGLFS